MLDQIKDSIPNESTPPAVPMTDVPPIDPAAQELEKLKQTYEAQIAQERARQSGINKALDETKKELESIKKSSMSDKERMEYERKLADQDKMNFEREKRELEIARTKFQFIAENQIDSKFEPFLSADTPEGLKAQIETLKSLIDIHVKPVRDELEKLKAEQGRPGGGSTPGLPQDARSKQLEAESRFRLAQQSGDIVAQNAAADEAFYWKEQALKIKK